MYKIYWIKYPEHTNPLTEGYIGLTSQNVEDRFAEHKHNRKNKLLSNRCRKENVTIVCLHDNLSKEEARLLEQSYRPELNIGWNINVGGDLPPTRKNKIGEKTILKGEARTEKQKEASRKHSEKMKGNNSSGKRKNRVVHEKTCANCNLLFISKSSKSKFCCIKCSALYKSKDVNYKNKMSELVKKQWKEKKLNV